MGSLRIGSFLVGSFRKDSFRRGVYRRVILGAGSSSGAGPNFIALRPGIKISY